MLRITEEGDVAAFKELFDRGFGRATQSIEMELDEKKLIQDDTPKSAIPSTIQAGVGIGHFSDTDDKK